MRKLLIGFVVLLFGGIGANAGEVNDTTVSQGKTAIPMRRSAESADINNDGNTTIADVTALVNIILGNISSDYNETAADVNGDESITIADVTALVNIILGKSNNDDPDTPGISDDPPIDIGDDDLPVD
ncbi:MAG: dockerin type I repeat-containing protein [Prevotella sp.]|nr:dockerin type I repeat-containing protein [Prevotella sp.]